MRFNGCHPPGCGQCGLLSRLTLPPVPPGELPVDNWQTSASTRRTGVIGALSPPEPGDYHRD